MNRIGAVLATMGCGDYNPLLRNRRQRLGELRTALGASLPPHAHAKISRMLDRLDLVRAQIAELEQDRDAVIREEVPHKAGEMIQHLAKLRGIGVQSATVLSRLPSVASASPRRAVLRSVSWRTGRALSRRSERWRES